MRVLLVCDFYPPLIGGASRGVQLLAQGLADRGHEVVVATSVQPGAPSTETDSHGVRVFRLNGLVLRMSRFSSNRFRKIPPPFPDPEMTIRLRRLISKVQPDVVHSTGWTTYSCALALAGRREPLIVSARDYGLICAVGTLVRRGSRCSGPRFGKCLDCSISFYGAPKGLLAVFGVYTGRPLVRARMNAMHSCSSHVRPLIRRILLRDPVTRPTGSTDVVIPDFRGVPGDPDLSVLASLPQQPFIMFVGALRTIKGIDVLLAAYERLRTRPPLVILGTRAPDSPTVFPDDVTVLYDVPSATVMAAWDRALFGVAPSVIAEPLGNVVHEAMSRGRVVVGTESSGHEDMIRPGVTGLLVRPGDVSELRQAMEWLIGHPEERAAMGRSAVPAAEAFTAEAVLPKFEHLYESALASQRK